MERDENCVQPVAATAAPALTAATLSSLTASFAGQSFSRLQLAADAVGAGLWEADLIANTIEETDRFVEMLGLPAKARHASATEWAQYLSHEGLERVCQKFFAAAESDSFFEDEQPILGADGKTRWIHCRATIMRDENGIPIRLTGVCSDVTARKLDEASLNDSEERFRAVFEQAAVGLAQMDLDGHWLRVNRRMSEILGYPLDELILRSFRDITHPDDLAADLAADHNLLVGQANDYSLEKRYIRKDGSIVWANLTVSLVRSASGQPKYFISVVRDITERKRTAARIAQLHSFTAALSEAVTSNDVARIAVEQGICALGASAGTLAMLNEDGASLETIASLGYPQGVMEPWQQFPLSAPIPLADAIRIGQIIYLGSPEERLRRYPVLTNVNPSVQTSRSACIPLLMGGKTVGVLGLSFSQPGDFSAEDREFMTSIARQCAQAFERTRLFDAEQRARAEAERANRAKDDFLAVLSHELRTPLTPVLLTVSMMETSPEIPQHMRDDLATIRRNIELESQLISDLLDLTRIARGKLQLDLQEVDLHLLIRAAIDICRREASAKVVVDLRATRHTVRGDSVRLQQIFWNLLNNAQKFTDQHGTITLRSSDTPDGHIRVEVIDTGVGIDESVLPRLFNAFEQGDARTSRQQAGLGLGLAISKRLAEAHGGTITATSPGRGRGASFVVDLPALEVYSHRAPAAPAAPAPAPSAPLSVLLVEDHEPSLRVLMKLLTHLGHRVTGASSVAAATSAARQANFDLIISDLGLPDGTGLDLMHQLKDQYSGRAIALTGYGMESDLAASREAGFAEHLIKPVDLQKLQSSILRVTTAAK